MTTIEACGPVDKNEELAALADRLQEQWRLEELTSGERDEEMRCNIAEIAEKERRRAEAAMTPEERAARRDYYAAQRARKKAARIAAMSEDERIVFAIVSMAEAIRNRPKARALVAPRPQGAAFYRW